MTPAKMGMVGFLCLAVALSGCAKAGASAQRIGNSLHDEGKKVDRKVRGWFDDENIGTADGEQRHVPQTAYCYKSIGERTCYSQPLYGEEDRLVGRQVPPTPSQPAYRAPIYGGEVVLIDPAGSVGVSDLPPARTLDGRPQELMPDSFD